MGNRKSLAPALAAALCLALAACATGRTDVVNDFGRFQQTQPGATTKPQLHAIFGQPHEVRDNEENGESVWTYYEILYRPEPLGLIPVVGILIAGVHLDVTRADFTFDAAGVLLRTQRSERRRFVHMFADMASDLTPAGQPAAIEQEMGRMNLPFDPREARRGARLADQLD